MTSQPLNRPCGVDVLAVLDEWIARAAHDPENVRMDREIRQARAAVAELIEAARGLIDFAEPILTAHGFGYVGRIEKARKALAAVRAQS